MSVVLRYSSGVDNVVCIMIFSAFLCISVIPEFIDVITGSNTGEPSSDRKWGLDLFIGGHNVLILPAVTTLRALAIFIQARATIGNQPSALSLLGLLVQAAVFTLVGLSWIVRVRYPPSVNNWSSWYHSVGWPVVGNLVYAIGQAILWCLARYGAGERLSSKLNAGGEVEPLLGKL
ncbi:hypothetical protein FQN54_009892 [Arachnomyces sp. PD_36]|nr:hypothetical protein FQN54_009892 [Arachnomyces sp. PD_36]